MRGLGTRGKSVAPRFLLRIRQKLGAATAEGNVDEVWTLACHIATDMLNHLCGNALPPSRGRVPKFEKRKIGVHHVSKHGVVYACAKARKLCLEIDVKVSRLSRGLCANQLWETGRNLNRVLNRLGCVLELRSNCSQVAPWAVFLNAARLSIDQREARFNKERSKIRLSNWRRRIKISSRADRKVVHQWLRDEPIGHPKAFKVDDGFTCDPNKMLDMIAQHMKSIYQYHAGQNVASMLSSFLSKYGASIESLQKPCDLPELQHWDLFRMMQKRPSYKASGLDGWLTIEMKHLPPSGWKAFALVMKIC